MLMGMEPVGALHPPSHRITSAFVYIQFRVNTILCTHICVFTFVYTKPRPPLMRQGLGQCMCTANGVPAVPFQRLPQPHATPNLLYNSSTSPLDLDPPLPSPQRLTTPHLGMDAPP